MIATYLLLHYRLTLNNGFLIYYMWQVNTHIDILSFEDQLIIDNKDNKTNQNLARFNYEINI